MFGELANSIVNSVYGTGELGLGIAGLVMQSRANQQQREDQRYYYEDQKKWQSPENQMNLRRIAGLNPYGDFPTGSVSQPVPVNTAQGMPELINGIQGSLSRSAERKFNLISQRIALKNLELQEKTTDKSLMLTEQQIRQLRSNTAYQDFVNDVMHYLVPFKKQIEGDLALKTATADSSIRSKEDKGWQDQFVAQLNNLLSSTKKNLEDIEYSKYQRENYLPMSLLLQKTLNEANIDLLKSRKDLTDVQADNEEVNKFAIKELKKTIDNMHDGFAKSFMQAILVLLTSGVKPSDF